MCTTFVSAVMVQLNFHLTLKLKLYSRCQVADVSSSCSDADVEKQAENLCRYLNFGLQSGPFYNSTVHQLGIVSPSLT